MIAVAILMALLCNLLIYLGVVSQIVLVEYLPAFYWWGIAFYVFAALVAIIFIVDTVRIVKVRRKKRDKARAPVGVRGIAVDVRVTPKRTNATVYRAPGKKTSKGKKK